MKTLNIGVVGFGFMGKAHTFAYKTIPLYYPNLPYQVNLMGVCAKHLERAEQAKALHGFSFATDNDQDIFNNPDIDCVSICTPTGIHKDAVLAALAAGKHVYCDKPLAANYNEAQQMAQAAATSGLTTQVAFQCRSYPGPMRAKELMEEGRLGQLLSFRIHFLHSGAVERDKPIGWRHDAHGGGVLFDLGSHALDMAKFLMGDFASLTAKLQQIYPTRPDGNGNQVAVTTDDAVLMMAQMACGAMGTIEATKIATGAEDELRFEIHGTLGAVSWNSRTPGLLQFFDNTQPETTLGGLRGTTTIECGNRYPGAGFPGGKFGGGFLRGHVHSLHSFLTAVAENRPASPSFEDGAYIQHVMEQAFVSDKTGTWVNI